MTQRVTQHETPGSDHILGYFYWIVLQLPSCLKDFTQCLQIGVKTDAVFSMHFFLMFILFEKTSYFRRQGFLDLTIISSYKTKNCRYGLVNWWLDKRKMWCDLKSSRISWIFKCTICSISCPGIIMLNKHKEFVREKLR